jgi:3-isopropylmalate dehydrogenase
MALARLASAAVPLRLLVLPGDGIGPELCSATLKVLRAASARFGVALQTEEQEIGLAALSRSGSTFPPQARERVAHCDGVILGPISHLDYPARDKGGVNVSAAFRLEWDLYANVRPARSRLGKSLVGVPMDLVIVRQSTEGFYADRNMASGPGEFMPTPDVALAVRKVTRAASARIAQEAFALAASRPRRRLAVVHKQNVLRLSDGLWLEEARRAAAAHPQVAVREVLVDAAAALLVRDPSQFDVILCENMFGDILSDAAGELSGSLGLAGSVNYGDSLCVAQAQHGSAPDIAGQGVANPTSLISSAAMLLQWLGRRRNLSSLRNCGDAIEAALDAALADPNARTRDLGGHASTEAFTARVVERVQGAL